jgi:hypothetical protein
MILLLLLTACGGASQPTEHYRAATNTTHPAISKSDAVWKLAETTPVMFNGEILYVSSYSGVTKIVRRSDGATMWSDNTGLWMNSAMVNSGTLYIFGTNNNHLGGTEVRMLSSADLVNWTPQVTVLRAQPNQLIYNTSVSLTPAGFVMAYEVCETGAVCFNARFAKSTDLVGWQSVGGVYEYGYYTACPTIRFVNGYYYMFFLSHYWPDGSERGYYATNVARSVDLVAWQFSSQTVLSPLDGGDSSMNASDMDLIEDRGRVLIVYANGSQWGESIPNSGVREATFTGTLGQLLLQFF